jgi:hypothetical protein
MERADVARLLNVAEADVCHYTETDESVSVMLIGDVARLWTPDGVFAVNDCPANRQLRPIPDEWRARGGTVTPQLVIVGETGPEIVDLPAGEVVTVSPPPVDEVPDGTAEQVLAWVDGDPDRAARAIDAEQSRDKPRSVLLANLRKVAGS